MNGRQRKNTGSSKSHITVLYIILLSFLTVLAYRLTGRVSVSYVTAGLLVYPIPYYYMRKLRPYKALAASIIVPVLAGTIAAITLYSIIGRPERLILEYRVPVLGLHVDAGSPLLVLGGAVAGIFTGGLASVLVSIAVYASLFARLVSGSLTVDMIYVYTLAGMLGSIATVIGMAVIRAARKKDGLKARTVYVLIGLLIVLSVAYVLAWLGMLVPSNYSRLLGVRAAF
ncbi:MAG: hypothetical protein LRS48_02670 [Desulfurococcales archaeon]|nr:hypothetical protein [Desulfurococcales archaeon]